ncbi:MAG: glucosamine-6-phosphate isomerase, partial [Lentisphaerae bacterium]|nr:glucosamine-6-phosphate isomerase [Lentisphaerota bacterium]
MARPISKVAPEWWDYTTLNGDLLKAAAKLTPRDLQQLARPGFTVAMYDTIEDFYLAEALEYITAWKQARPGRPAGICGPIGPTEQLPLVARLVNALDLNLKDAVFWGMDEWFMNGKAVPVTHPLSFAKADMDLCFNRIRRELRPRLENLHFPSEGVRKYSESYNNARCVIMQGGQGEVKHWAFNDPPRR